MERKNKYTIAIDLDSTICQSIRRNRPDDILKVKPFNDKIEIVKNLKKRGHTIIIFTRRGILEKGRELTIEWLKKYKVPYDELITEKPHFDLLWDDRAFSPYQSGITYQVIERYAEFIHEQMQKSKIK